jgi:hypothetical protein
LSLDDASAKTSIEQKLRYLSTLSTASLAHEYNTGMSPHSLDNFNFLSPDGQLLACVLVLPPRGSWLEGSKLMRAHLLTRPLHLFGQLRKANASNMNFSRLH